MVRMSVITCLMKFCELSVSLGHFRQTQCIRTDKILYNPRQAFARRCGHRLTPSTGITHRLQKSSDAKLLRQGRSLAGVFLHLVFELRSLSATALNFPVFQRNISRRKEIMHQQPNRKPDKDSLTMYGDRFYMSRSPHSTCGEKNSCGS
jgi:hypothetical protein